MADDGGGPGTKAATQKLPATAKKFRRSSTTPMQPTGTMKKGVQPDPDGEVEVIKATLRKQVANYIATSVLGVTLDVVGVLFSLVSGAQ